MQRLTTPLLYLVVGTFIIGWWGFAFRQSEPPFSSPNTVHSQTLSLKTSQLLQELSPLQREALHQALSGNFSKMFDLIEQWDLDAQILKRKGIQNIQRLSSDQYCQAQILSHLINHSSPQVLRDLNCKMNLESIQDDTGKWIKIEDSYRRFLPQTFVAASFLLAIAQPQELISIPTGMRYLTQLYLPEKLAFLPNQPLISEKLYLDHPHVAFVAPYSHPPALEMLRNHNIQLFNLKHLNKVSEIPEALLKIGHASNHILEAQLLAIFMEASLLAIDNRLQALFEKSDLNSYRMLYLCYRENFTTPSSKCLTGQLMERALAHCPQISCPIPKNTENWLIPIDQEQILHSDPDFLLIATPFNSNRILHNALALKQSKAYKTNRIFFIDESIQDSPTQFIVLAYYDIYHALTALYL